MKVLNKLRKKSTKPIDRETIFPGTFNITTYHHELVLPSMHLQTISTKFTRNTTVPATPEHERPVATVATLPECCWCLWRRWSGCRYLSFPYACWDFRTSSECRRLPLRNCLPLDQRERGKFQRIYIRISVTNKESSTQAIDLIWFDYDFLV